MNEATQGPNVSVDPSGIRQEDSIDGTVKIQDLAQLFHVIAAFGPVRGADLDREFIQLWIVFDEQGPEERDDSGDVRLDSFQRLHLRVCFVF